MRFRDYCVTACAAIFAGLEPGASALATTPVFTTLVSFNGANGNFPVGGLAVDLLGNLYGTTEFGGRGVSPTNLGNGTVFELSGSGHRTLSTVVAFDGVDGANPTATLILDLANNFYGTTATGGGPDGGGTAFRLSGAGHTTRTTLATFTGANGGNPTSALSFGLTPQSTPPFFSIDLFGAANSAGPNGNGTIFRLSGANFQTMTTVDAVGGTIGEPAGLTVIADAAGNLFAVNAAGGRFGQGTVFELSGPTHGTMTVLATFTGTNGAFPLSSLTFDRSGNLYGTTSTGGPSGNGTVFELSGPTHQTLTTLLSFGTGEGGAAPVAAVLIDAAGTIFGTTSAGGETGNGTVFKISADHHAFTVLHTFDGSHGARPLDSLTADFAGNLYGTTALGGTNDDGTAFELTGTGFVGLR